MQYGLHLPASSATVKPDELVGFAQQAEALGFNLLTVADHVIVRLAPQAHSGSPDDVWPSESL